MASPEETVSDFHEVKCVQNKEEYTLPADGDSGEDRIRYRVLECPLGSECSKDAWKRAAPWSYISNEKCRSYVAWHLHKSAKHFKTADEAVELAYLPEVTEEIETFSDRQADREEEAPKHEAGAMPKSMPVRPPIGSARVPGYKVHTTTGLAVFIMRT